MLLVVDALADHGRSGGVDGAASSLDVTVRAAAAIAEHHVRARRPGRAAGGRRRRRARVGYGAGAAPPAADPRPAGARSGRRARAT